MLSKRIGALSFFLLHRIPLCKCTIVFWSIHLPIGCFQHLAVVNCAMNIRMHRIFWSEVSGFLGYNPNSGIARSKGSSIFSFLRKFNTVFHTGLTSLHSHQQCTRVPFCPQPRHHLLFVAFLMMTILTDVKWNLMMILICISVMASDAGHPLHVI